MSAKYFLFELTFDNHVNNLCKKGNNKLSALARATSYMNIEKKKFLMYSFLMHNLIVVPLYECCLVVAIAIKSSTYTRAV